jgi:hypothetical protein
VGFLLPCSPLKRYLATELSLLSQKRVFGDKRCNLVNFLNILIHNHGETVRAQGPIPSRTSSLSSRVCVELGDIMAVLSAPTNPQEVHILNTVILVVAIFSVIGAGWIILSFLVS